MDTTKAIILAAGRGTRMRERISNAPGPSLTAEQERAADSGIKGMIPVGRPFLDYAISALADAGILDVCIIVSPDDDVIRNHYSRTSTARVRIHFAVQRQPLGAADAVLAAEAFADGEHVLCVNSDNYYPVSTLRALREDGGAAVAVFERDTLVRKSNIESSRVAQYAIVSTDDHDHLTRIIEKPDVSMIGHDGGHVYVSMNSWCLPPEIFDACRSIERSARGELELQSAVQYAIDVIDIRFHVLRFNEGVLDLSSRRDIPAVTAALHNVVPNL